MEEKRVKSLDIDLTAILREIEVLEEEYKTVVKQIERLKDDVESGDISNKAASRLTSKLKSERDAIKDAIKKVLSSSIDKAKEIQKVLDEKKSKIK
jgi:Asp-tRNA(Asn)/Glu-tRNA(Gln) amidotransferase B subunit